MHQSKINVMIVLGISSIDLTEYRLTITIIMQDYGQIFRIFQPRYLNGESARSRIKTPAPQEL